MILEKKIVMKACRRDIIHNQIKVSQVGYLFFFLDERNQLSWQNSMSPTIISVVAISILRPAVLWVMKD